MQSADDKLCSPEGENVQYKMALLPRGSFQEHTEEENPRGKQVTQFHLEKRPLDGNEQELCKSYVMIWSI